MTTGWNLENSYARLPTRFFRRRQPVPVANPSLVILNEGLARELGLDPVALRGDEGVQVLAGNALPPGSVPLAQAYAGHQFGYFTMLGDGRAILLGEQITPRGERFDIQLKGAGPTIYSRGGDGRAALGPMLREYIISEAMHALGIPTTRALAVVATGEKIFRERPLPGAVLTRVAASHLRVGTFQFAAAWGTVEELEILADYALERHFPDVDRSDPDRFLELLRHVVRRQAWLVSRWMLVGFVHGVMNTDNMTISGETIDYGPCAFMEAFDPATVFSSIDHSGRYAYGRQPAIAAWNLARFAEALLPLLHPEEEKAVDLAQEVIAQFPALFQEFWLDGMRSKLGLFNKETGDTNLVEDLLRLMQSHKADYTNTFRALTMGRPDLIPMAGTGEWQEWHRRWQERLGWQPQGSREVQEMMQRSNPAVIPRNLRVEEALTAAVDYGDFEPLRRLEAALSDPFDYSQDFGEYVQPAPESCPPYVTYCGT